MLSTECALRQDLDLLVLSEQQNDSELASICWHDNDFFGY